MRPTLWGSQSIIGKAMTIYELYDDFGNGGTTSSEIWGSSGRPIACCNITGYKVIQEED